MNRVYVLLVIIGCAGVLLLADITPAGAWFTDTKAIEGITNTTGSWSDCAGDLEITACKPHLRHAKTTLTGITITNTGQDPLTIAGIRISWSPGNGEMIHEVAFTHGWGGRPPHAGSNGHGHGGSTVFWSGEAESGQVLEGQASLGPATQDDSAQNIRLSFDSNMEGKQIVCTVILDDGSGKEVSLEV